MRSFIGLLLLICLTACDGSPGINQGFPAELLVVSRNAPTTWYEGREGPQGPEYDLIKSFADYYGIPFKIQSVDSIGEVLESIRQGRAHIAAAGLTDTAERREQGYIFGPEYFKVQQQVVCRRGDTLPRKVEDLTAKNIHVIADSSYVETLEELRQQLPDLKWQVVDDMGTEQILEQVWSKEIDCTLADSNIVNINRRYFPELVVAFPVSEEQSLAWLVNPEWKHLLPKLDEWIEHVQDSGELATIRERYYGHVELFDYVDMRKFITRIKKRLPKYQVDFQKAAKKHGLDWQLLAAQAYQESHWNPRAKSPTGVRGMMMLTLDTAKQMGVESRLDARQSIEGGAKYLARMIKRVPESVQGENRLWFALAAYNVGFGHLRDALTLAKKLGKNPDEWVDLKQVLPLLAQKKYYKSLKYGYARGSEPVRYVQSIRDYQLVLSQYLTDRQG